MLADSRSRNAHKKHNLKGDDKAAESLMEQRTAMSWCAHAQPVQTIKNTKKAVGHEQKVSLICC